MDIEQEDNIKEEIKDKEEQSKDNNEKSDKKKSNKITKIITIIILTIVIIAILSVGGIFAYKHFSKKFKDAYVEIGSEQIKLEDFLVDEDYKDDSKIITDLSQIDLYKIGEYEIELEYKGKRQKVMLYMQDTTPPAVEFQDILKYLDYEINPNDFIVNKSDLSEMTVELGGTYEITGFGTYKINVIVKDQYNNVTSKECNLTIGWIKPEFTLELGNKITKEDLLYSVEQDGDKLNQEELDKINSSGPGEYEIKVIYEGQEYVTKIKVQDTTPPDLILQDVIIYDDETVEKDRFIKSVTDASGEITTTLLTKIDYSRIGAQEIVVEAVDKNNNQITKTAILTIKKDTEGPVFQGITNLTVNKYTKINYNKGVTAIDERDGSVTFTVDDSKVNTSVAGTYYATYTATDKKGNTTTKKRKITVNHDQADTNAKVREMSQKCGNDYESIRQFVKSKISYNASDYGGSDPIWHGFTEYKGNCLVFAKCYQALLNQKGYSTQLIWTTDKSHYWVLVKINGVWRHSDATPGGYHGTISAATDDERYANLQGRDWDRTKWPEAK